MRCINYRGSSFAFRTIFTLFCLFQWNGIVAAEEGTCSNAGECKDQGVLKLEEDRSKCTNEHEKCVFWSTLGECEKNPKYMHVSCARACNTCNSQVRVHKNDWGEPQELKQKDGEATYDLLVKTQEYMLSEVYVEEKYISIKHECKNRHSQCGLWASQGECNKNPNYMNTQCAPSCQTCHLLDFNTRCPFDDNAPKAWKPDDLDGMFKRITTEEHYQQYKPVIYSRPKSASPGYDPASDGRKNYHRHAEVNENGFQIVDGGPWVVTLESFLTDEECDTLVKLGAEKGYERSADVGAKKFDGSYEKYENPGRTSTNTWCMDECYEDPMTKKILAKLENVTGIPDANSEYLQLLRYEVGQKYQTHHDYIAHQTQRTEGVRLLTVFLYLNDVEAGGGTDFPRLGITVMPKKGKALLWPSVLNHNPDAKDGRTHHQALPVEAGVKYGANAWVHARDFKEPHSRSCI